jgi:hypothetical protein
MNQYSKVIYFDYFNNEMNIGIDNKDINRINDIITSMISNQFSTTNLLPLGCSIKSLLQVPEKPLES